jgi:hypothetical protein
MSIADLTLEAHALAKIDLVPGRKRTTITSLQIGFDFKSAFSDGAVNQLLFSQDYSGRAGSPR